MNPQHTAWVERLRLKAAEGAQRVRAQSFVGGTTRELTPAQRTGNEPVILGVYASTLRATQPLEEKS